jgi:hypothetical protein
VLLLLLLVPIMMPFLLSGGDESPAKRAVETIRTLPASQAYPLFVVAHALAILVCFPGTIAFEWAAGGMFGQVGGQFFFSNLH